MERDMAAAITLASSNQSIYSLVPGMPDSRKAEIFAIK